MFGWLFGRGASKADVSHMQARITPELWAQTLSAHAFLQRLGETEREQLKRRVAWFLASKRMSGAGGLALTDEMMMSIAAQACLPILMLEPALYEGWSDVIVYPGGFLIPRSNMDEDGVVHEYVEEAVGEAWDGGPVILSWEDAAPRGAADAPECFNVVIHEFAHKLDLAHGDVDGLPDLGAHPELSPRVWRRVLEDAHERFAAQLDEVEAAIPPDVDPESAEAAAWYDELPLDPYAATDVGEFFAVSSEAFFVHPWPLREALPEWYELLRRYYRQDPLAGE